MLEKLKSFRGEDISANGDILQAGILIKEVLLKVKEILENHGEYNDKIETLTKEILTRAIMLDTTFNHLYDLTWHTGGGNQVIEKEYNDLYYHTPAIGIFFNGAPIFLNKNYVDALGAESADTLKQDIIQKKALEKYYIPESQGVAKTAILKLGFGEGYKDLKLTTVGGKTISWNSFGKRDGLEIRIGNDVTYGTFKRSEIGTSINNEDLTLKTKQLIYSYIIEVGKIINLDPSDRGRLMVFALLSEILDKIWNDGQFLMNMTIEKNENSENRMTCNNNYLNAIGLTLEELEEKIRNNTLYRDHYTKETEILIKGLWETLKEEGYYISDFTMLDKNRVPKNYSWYRKLIEIKELGIHRTFGIGNNAISEDNAEIMRLIGELK